MFKKILMAKRGEIALRIIRGCHALGIRTVAVHSQADADSLHVRFADEAVCIGPPPAKQSYLHVPAIIAAAEISGVDAIHPGYGFLSENAEFADICRQCGLTFIGPTPEDMQTGVTSHRTEERAALGLPLLPAPACCATSTTRFAEAERVGYPLISRHRAAAAARMQVLRNETTYAPAFRVHAPGHRRVQERRPLPRALHRGAAPHRFQVLCDCKATHWCRERDCSSTQAPEAARRAAVPPSRSSCATTCLTIARAMRDSGYHSLGTLEFLLDERGELTSWR